MEGDISMGQGRGEGGNKVNGKREEEGGVN